MKKLFALCLLAVTMCAMAQEKTAIYVVTIDTLSDSLVNDPQIANLSEQDSVDSASVAKRKGHKKATSIKDLFFKFTTPNNNERKRKRQQRKFDKYVNEYKSKMQDSTLTKEGQIKLLLSNF